MDPKLHVIGALLGHCGLIRFGMRNSQPSTLNIRIRSHAPYETKAELTGNINDPSHIISELPFRRMSLLSQQGLSCGKVIKLKKTKKEFIYITDKSLQEALVIATGPVLILVRFFNYRIRSNHMFVTQQMITTYNDSYSKILTLIYTTNKS